ncbi:MAG: mevalonate kinase family protein [Promethearchaeota archaeon]
MIRIRAPGRVCLFGEHQDYLNFPVIAMAISKYIYLEAERINEQVFMLDLPDLGDTIEIKLDNKELDYVNKRDYLRSGYNQFIRKRIKFKKGYKIKITGDIPINAGAASSSALVIAWLYFLNIISNNPLVKKSDLALLGNQAEVGEFNEAGGMMDHYSSSYGNVIYLEPKPNQPHFIARNIEFTGFVLGNSLEKKETINDLIRIKTLALNAFRELKKIMPEFNQFKSSFKMIEPFLPSLEKKYQEKIIGNIINRNITLEAKKLMIDNFAYNFYFDFEVQNKFYQQLGTLLNKHQEQLREHIKISTRKIDTMIENSLEAGAYGAKINGSGFGGTMFALAPNQEEKVKKAILHSGGDAEIITTSKGVGEY